MSERELAEHEERIAQLLSRKAWQAVQEGLPPESVTHHTPLAVLLAGEIADDEDEQRRRSEVLAAFVDFVLQDGAHPAAAMKNFFAVVHALRPQALAHWTCEDFGQLFGQTKAAHSWRVKKLFGPWIEARGSRPIRARFQKAASATRNYSEAQKGNRNRRHGLARPDEKKAA